MRFPTIQDVTSELADYVQQLRDWRIDEGDVRLQVDSSGAWALHTGDASYDTDHSGFWGASSVTSQTTKGELREIARAT